MEPAARHEATLELTPASARPAVGYLVALAAAAAVIRFANITSQSLWLDEGYTLAYARSASPKEVIRTVLECHTTDCASPLHPILLHFVIAWSGDSVVVLRGVSAVCGVLTVIALMLAGRVLFDQSASVIAGGLVALSAFDIWYSQEARAYSLLILLTCLELLGMGLCLEDTQQRPRWRYRLLLALSVGMGILGNVLFALGAAAVCGAHALRRRNWPHWWSTWWPAIVAGLPPLLFFAAAQASNQERLSIVTSLRQSGLLNLVYAVYGQLVGLTFGPPQSALRGAGKLHVLGEHKVALASAAVLLVLILATVVAARRAGGGTNRRDRNAEILLASIAVGAVLAAGLTKATGINWQPRHSFFLFPPVLLVVSFSVSTLLRSTATWRRLLALSAMMAWCTVNLWSVHNYNSDPKYAKDDYRGAAATLVAEQRAGHKAVLLNGLATLLTYYGDTTIIDLADWPVEEQLRYVRTRCSRGEGMVAVFNRAFAWRGGTDIPQILGEQCPVRGHRQLQNFDMYKLGGSP